MDVHLVIPARGIGSITAAVAALAALNGLYLRSHSAPLLYASGVEYCEPVQASHGGQDLLTIPKVLKAGAGSCGDLSAWRIAELHFEGERAEPIMTRIGNLWHVRVRRGDGRIEDPSALLGMNDRRRRQRRYG